LGFVLAVLLSLNSAKGQVYDWSNFAGKSGGPGNADGAGSAARFDYPTDIAMDTSGNIYVADTNNSTIRKITSDGVVTTLAGTAGSSGSVDGTGSAARFNQPNGIAVDASGNVYVADSGNHTIRKITSSGVVTTLAGMAGSFGSVDGTGSAARFNGPSGVAVDASGNVYVADSNNSTIRKINVAGEVTTLAGTAGSTGSADGTGSVARFYFPNGIAVDTSGNVYVADIYNSTIRKITSAGVVTTLAGTARSFGSVDGTRSVARLYRPFGVAVDASGNVYVADVIDSTIRKIDVAGDVTTLAGMAQNSGSVDGTGSAARFKNPTGIAVDSSGNVYVADLGNSTIRKINVDGDVTTLAGTAGSPGSADGTGSAARFFFPTGIAVDASGNVYVADSNNNTIRKITGDGDVTTLAGTAESSGSEDGTGSAARFSYPSGIAVDASGNVYVADLVNFTIRKITSAGVVTTLAGTAGSYGSVDGTGSAARFNQPSGIAVDASGNVYVADLGNSTIRKITSAGEVTTLAGTAESSGSADGTGSAARFNYPTGIAADASGNVYVADSGSSTIRKITSAGVVTTLAGSAGNSGSEDGAGSAARFNYPNGIAVDASGNVYVADSSNSTIRKITSAGVVTTIGGRPGVKSGVDGLGTAAAFNGPSGIAATSLGALYVADQVNNRISQGIMLFALTVSSPTASSITLTGATLGGHVTDNLGAAITERGVIYSATASNRNPLLGGAGVTKLTSTGTTGVFTVPVMGLLLNTSYSYKAYATNSYGTSYTSVAVFTTPPSNAPRANITPERLTVDPGGLAIFTANVVSGIAPYTYQWRKNLVKIGGANKPSYTLASAQQSHEGSYDCVVSNAYGSFTTSAALLTVTDPVVIVASPLSRSANLDEAVLFSVKATGTGPMQYQWRKNGVALPGKTGPSLNLITDANSGGLYDVVVTNLLGSITSSLAPLTLLTAPVILAQPSNQNAGFGSTVFFSVTANGVNLTYQWRRNGVDLSNQTGAMLVLSNVQKAQEGVYDVLVKNASGAVLSDPATLSLLQALSISEHPQDVTSIPGDTASFSVTAAGPGTLIYQWNKDGKLIKDARASTLNVPVTDQTVAAAYTVTVSSGSLKLTSSPAHLRVSDAGLLIYQFTLTGNSFVGTSSSKIALSGTLVLDRLNQRGGIIRFAKNGTLNTFLTKVDDGLRTDSTGPVLNSQTVVSKVVKAEESPEQETTTLWLRGTDGLVTFSNTDKTMAPKTLAGFQTELNLAGATEMAALNLTATLDIAASLQARQAGETVELTLSRLAGGWQQKGFIRQ